MNLKIYNTHMEVTPYSQDDLPQFEKMFTAVDRFSQKEYPCAYMIFNNTLYLPKGTPTQRYSKEFDSIEEINQSDPYITMSQEHEAFYQPRNQLQQESIDFLCSGKPQLGLNLATGFGKTFCVASAVTKMKLKTIVITPNESLKLQWIKTFSEMFDYSNKNLINITGSNIITGIMDNSIEANADVYFVNHQTLRSYMTSFGSTALHEFFKKLKVGIKVYDESHMEFGNILLIDFFTNTKFTFYLTATFDRSDKSESNVFQKAFKSVITFGESESTKAVPKHVIYHVVNINSRATYKEKMKITGWQGMTTASYAKYAFFTDKNETTYYAIKTLIEKVKDCEGKILIFVGLIDAIEKVVSKLKKDFPEKTIGAFHSKVSKEEKDSVIKKDIIVSTVKSCGTGKDIKGLRTVICAEELASKILAKQIIGRLRPFAEGKDTFYFDIVNVCIPSVTFWFRARFKTIQPLAKEVIYLNIDK